MAEINRKPEGEEIDPAQMAKLLEIELMQKRATWKQAKSRQSNFRLLSYLFLLIVIAGAIAAYFLVVSFR